MLREFGSGILVLTAVALACVSCGKRAPPASAFGGPRATVEVHAPAITQYMAETFPDLEGTARCAVPVDFPEGWPVPQLFTVDDCWREDPEIGLDVLRELQRFTLDLRFGGELGSAAPCRTIIVLTYEFAGPDSRLYAESSGLCYPRRL